MTYKVRAFACACIAVLLAILSGACGREPPRREWTPADHGQPATPDDVGADSSASAQAEPGEDPNARAARALWNATCAGCHGREGHGDGPSKPPIARIPDFATAAWQGSRSDEQLAQAIHDGRGMMPSFGKQLNAEGIAVLVQHIRSFAPAQQADQAGAGRAASSAEAVQANE